MRRNNRYNRNRRNFIKIDDTKKLTSILIKLIIVLSVAFLIVVIFNITKNWLDYKKIVDTANKEFNATNISENVSSDTNADAESSDTIYFNCFRRYYVSQYTIFRCL